MAETRRRLPPWMLKQKTETKAPQADANLKSEEKSEDQIKGKHVKRKQRKRALEDKSEDQNEQEPGKREPRRKISKQVRDELDEAEVKVQRCQIRQRNSRARRKDETEIGEEKEGSAEDLKRKRSRKRMLVISDDETDLTVDDLVSIAEEVIP